MPTHTLPPATGRAVRFDGYGAARPAAATFPSGEGTDLAGVVLGLGPEVEGVAIGDEVLGYSWAR